MLSVIDYGANQIQYTRKGKEMATLFIRDFPEDLHEQARILAIKEKASLREIIARALRLYIEQTALKEA